MEYGYEFLIINNLKDELVIDPSTIHDSEQALMILFLMNEDIISSGGYPNFELRVRPKIKIGD